MPEARNLSPDPSAGWPASSAQSDLACSSDRLAVDAIDTLARPAALVGEQNS